MSATHFIRTKEDANFVLQMLEDTKKAVILQRLGWDLQELRDACDKASKPPDVPLKIIEAAHLIHSWFASQGITNWELMNVRSRP